MPILVDHCHLVPVLNPCYQFTYNLAVVYRNWTSTNTKIYKIVHETHLISYGYLTKFMPTVGIKSSKVESHHPLQPWEVKRHLLSTMTHAQQLHQANKAKNLRPTKQRSSRFGQRVTNHHSAKHAVPSASSVSRVTIRLHWINGKTGVASYVIIK